MTKLKKETGQTIYLALVVLSVILGIGIGLSSLLFYQLKMTKEIGDSVIALCAADSGVERALYAIYVEGELSFSTSTTLGNMASYQVSVFPSSSCAPPVQYYCIKSYGIYKNTTRAIEASF